MLVLREFARLRAIGVEVAHSMAHSLGLCILRLESIKITHGAYYLGLGWGRYGVILIYYFS